VDLEVQSPFEDYDFPMAAIPRCGFDKRQPQEERLVGVSSLLFLWEQ
jgi:hypothetical protein